MKIFGIEIRRASKKEIQYNKSLYSKGPYMTASFLGSKNKPMLLSAVYRCVELLASSISQLELQTIKFDDQRFPTPAIEHPAYDLLAIEPNQDMSAYSFFHALIASTILRGNGYAYIQRDKRTGQPISIDFLAPESVEQVWISLKNGRRARRYSVVGFKEYVEPKDMIHIMNFTYDGLTGVSTLTHARDTLQIASSNEEHTKEFFDGGAAMDGILTFETAGRLKPGQKDEIYESWNSRRNPNTGAKSSIVVLDGNQKYQPISISPKDSQMLESRQFNVIDICRFFGVSPVKAFDLTKSSYSTVEASNLDFLTGTLAPLLTNIEQEINRKVFVITDRHKYEAKFNLHNLLRVDRQTAAAYNKDMFYIGAKSPNEVRREEGLPRMKGGDGTYVPVNMVPMEQAGQIDTNTTNNE